MMALTLLATEAQLRHAMFLHPTLSQTMGEAMLAGLRPGDSRVGDAVPGQKDSSWLAPRTRLDEP
jgi:hypothetical protein